MTPRPLLLLGGGGLAREALAAARTMPGDWQPLDDDTVHHGGHLDGPPVLGGSDLVHEYPDAAVLACMAGVYRPGSRARVVRRLGLPAGVVVTAPQRIGGHVVAMPHVLLTHDDRVSDFVTLAGRATLAGTVHIGESAYVGQGAMVRENLKIGERAVIGMGSVVLRDVPAGETWAGSPARRLSARPALATGRDGTERGAAPPASEAKT